MSGAPQSGTAPGGDSVHCLDDAAYVLGSLSPVERQAYELHLAGCARCQAAVGRLAGLPGLLAGTAPTDIAPTTDRIPDTLLPRLLTAVDRERHRRVILSGLVGAAAAAVIAVVIGLVTWPATPTQQPSAAPVQMQSLVAAPLNVSLQFSDKRWGTSVVVHCADEGPSASNDRYQLVAFDPAGTPQTLGWWTSVAGAATTVSTASSLHLKDISRVEVQLSDGKPVLRAVPPSR